MLAGAGCIACIHLIAAIGFAIGGPLLALAGYFVAIAVAISVLIYFSERPRRSNQREPGQIGPTGNAGAVGWLRWAPLQRY